MALRPATGPPPVPRHRLHVISWLRRPGGLMLADWLAITIGRDIFSWRELDPVELAHELEHVRQWNRYGLVFAARYQRASFHSWRAGTGWYRGNRFEVAARAAADREALHRPNESATARFTSSGA